MEGEWWPFAMAVVVENERTPLSTPRGPRVATLLPLLRRRLLRGLLPLLRRLRELAPRSTSRVATLLSLLRRLRKPAH